MADNKFPETIGALFEGIDKLVTSKTVVGEAVQVGNAMIVPLVDVSCGMAAGTFDKDHKNKKAGGMNTKISPSAVLVIQDGVTKLVSVKHQDPISKIIDVAPDLVNRFASGKNLFVSKEAADKAEEMAEELADKED